MTRSWPCFYVEGSQRGFKVGFVDTPLRKCDDSLKSTDEPKEKKRKKEKKRRKKNPLRGNLVVFTEGTSVNDTISPSSWSVSYGYSFRKIKVLHICYTFRATGVFASTPFKSLCETGVFASIHFKSLGETGVFFVFFFSIPFKFPGIFASIPFISLCETGVFTSIPFISLCETGVFFHHHL